MTNYICRELPKLKEYTGPKFYTKRMIDMFKEKSKDLVFLDEFQDWQRGINFKTNRKIKTTFFTK